MTSTTTFGDFPGVRVQTVGGAITGVAVGREQNLVVVGEGITSGNNAASASANTATQVNSRLDAETQFGADSNGDPSELAAAVQDALANGANIDFLWGVLLDHTSVTDEDVTSGGDEQDSSGGSVISNTPIREDPDSSGSGNEESGTLTFTDDSGTDLTVEYRYEPDAASLSTPSSSDTVFINPITGAWKADAADNYEIDYDYPDWSSALAEAETVFDTEETGIIAALTESSSTASTLDGNVNTLRGNYKMAMGLSVAEPNISHTDDNDADYDTGSYTDSIDNDAYFFHAPGRKEDSVHLITGALGGKMAGANLGPGGSIFRDSLSVDNLDIRFSDSDATDMRDEQVIPIVQSPSGGTIRIDDNLSTSVETDWSRDYWSRRVVDQVILIAKQIGDAVLGQINDSDSRDTVEEQMRAEMRGLADDRLIDPVEDEDWFVDVYEVDNDTVGLDVGVTPTGIAKEVDTTVTINTA